MLLRHPPLEPRNDEGERPNPLVATHRAFFVRERGRAVPTLAQGRLAAPNAIRFALPHRRNCTPNGAGVNFPARIAIPRRALTLRRTTVKLSGSNECVISSR